ncbi:hypothetical protein CMO88_00945 [Candidatus Woesearchaeota archaeon]|nr:hypothetical protein [Candidatus Woesearchaeota archaeon]|tara:strand:- start:1736 stop:3406 length:1671 start_codon:yes stop_codon:yes gene_type:complete
MTTVLGLTGLEPYSENTHDSSACITDKAKIIGAVSEERFTRNRHHAGFPWMSVNYLLKLGYLYSDVDAVAIPWPLEKNTSKKLKIVKQLYSAIPRFKAEFHRPILPFEKKKIIGIGHQRAHAASAYRTSGFKKALVVSLDLGGSEEDVVNAEGGIFVGENGNLKRIKAFTSGFGMFYAFVTEGLGFRAVDGEGKTMGLAAYGDPHTGAYKSLKNYASTVRGIDLIKQKRNFKASFAVVNNYQRFVFNDLNRIRSLVKRFSDKDVAAAAQKILEERVTELIENALKETGMNKLCLAGRVFLNVKLNKKLRELKKVKDIYIYPNPGDAGTVVGAALEAHHNLTGEKTIPQVENNVYLGPEYSDSEIEAVLKKNRGLSYRKTSDPSGDAAELISRGRIIGWFQGRMEWSSRALGARSILAAPHDVKIKEKLNSRLKQQDFSAFAPSILLRDAHEYLKNPSESPFMLMAYDVLLKARDDIAATVHTDNTVVPQTVTKEQNPLYYDLIREYDKMTGVPAVLHTSLRRHNWPIVCTPEDALDYLFMKCVDYLVIGNFIVKLK